MSLRPRLALILLAAAVPLVAGVLWLRHGLELKRLDDALAQFAFAHMSGGGRARCEADPTRFVVDLRPPEARSHPARPHTLVPPQDLGASAALHGTVMWAYGQDLRSSNPHAPEMPAELRGALESGGARASGPWSRQHREGEGVAGRQVLVRMPWSEGPCAVMLVTRPFSGDEGTYDAFLIGAIALAVGLLAAVLLAIGPIVRRLRRLSREVVASARAGYESEVDVGRGDEIGELAQAFNEAGHQVRDRVEQLEDREATLRAFVANTTHDVMLPLTVLQGNLALLHRREEYGQKIDPDVLEAAMEEAHYLGCLVQNLAAVAKLEAGEIHLDEGAVDLNAMVERVVGRHRTMASGRQVALDYAVPPETIIARGDVTLLEQAVSNLVHNAIRYNERGHHVALVLTTTRGPAPQFSLRVIDDGPGIPEAELPRVTQRAFRGESARTRRPHGTGLGLHIAADVAARHDFELEVRASEVGGLLVELTGVVAAVRPAL